ncbi:uncharacterized protein [Asterias amurensis]|uniref:uncharacterized protein isoform X2 n=1 Tax=Asterias amurensis TaxID=7602 RepID=UPI003AB7FF23
MESTRSVKSCVVKRKAGHLIEDILGIKTGNSNTAEQAAVHIVSCPAESTGSGPLRKRRRRARTIFTEDQRQQLEVFFTDDQYPDITSREVLAESIGMSEARVQVWFQNRRARTRRHGRPNSTGKLIDSSSSEDGDESAVTPTTTPKPTETGHLSPSTSASPVGSDDLTTGVSSPSATSPYYGLPYEQYTTVPSYSYGYYGLNYGSSAHPQSPPYGYTVATVPGRYTSSYDAKYLGHVAPISVFDPSSYFPQSHAQSTPIKYSSTDGLLAIAK